MRQNTLIPTALMILGPDGVQNEAVFEGVGVWGGFLKSFFQGSKQDYAELIKTNSCSVEPAISYFTFKHCFKTRITVVIDDLLFMVG